MSTAAAPQPGRFLPEPVTRAGQPTGFDMPAMASYYGFPARFDGTGTTIALLSLYGGFRRSDLDTYFSAMGLATPAIDVIGVGGASNNPVADPDANLELVMSLELLGSIAPGARLAVYLAGNNELGVVDGLGTAISGQGDVLCLTWAADESGANGMMADVIDRSMKHALLIGLPVCAPARAAGGRLVPDVAALADPQIGYRCYVNGRWASVSGPGAAACLWAGLLARLHQALGRSWGMVSDLYSALGPSGALAAVPAAAAGSRPAWDSRAGWEPRTGSASWPGSRPRAAAKGQP